MLGAAVTARRLPLGSQESMSTQESCSNVGIETCRRAVPSRAMTQTCGNQELASLMKASRDPSGDQAGRNAQLESARLLDWPRVSRCGFVPSDAITKTSEKLKVQ